MCLETDDYCETRQEQVEALCSYRDKLGLSCFFTKWGGEFEDSAFYKIIKSVLKMFSQTPAETHGPRKSKNAVCCIWFSVEIHEVLTFLKTLW